VRQGLTEAMVTALATGDQDVFTPRERVALRFATLLAQDHHALDDAVFRELREHLTEPEIIELGLVTAQCLGFGRLIAALDLENPCQPAE